MTTDVVGCADILNMTENEPDFAGFIYKTRTRNTQFELFAKVKE